MGKPIKSARVQIISAPIVYVTKGIMSITIPHLSHWAWWKREPVQEGEVTGWSCFFVVISLHTLYLPQPSSTTTRHNLLHHHVPASIWFSCACISRILPLSSVSFFLSFLFIPLHPFLDLGSRETTCGPRKGFCFRGGAGIFLTGGKHMSVLCILLSLCCCYKPLSHFILSLTGAFFKRPD